MQTRDFRLAAPLAIAATIAVVSGCDRPVGAQSARADAAPGLPVAKVALVRSQRATVRRISEEPGQVEAAETTPVYAKLAGYVESVAVDIGDKVKKGQVLAVLRVPEIDADLKQKRAEVKQARAELKQSEAAVEVAQAKVESAKSKVEEARSSIRRSEADVSRWQSEFSRVEQLFRERALTGSLLDETRSKLHSAEAGRDEVKAQVRSAESALVEAAALLDKARSDADAATSRIDVAGFEAERAEAMAGYARLVAPYDGVVTKRGVDTGHLTTPGTTGEPLFVVARSDVVTVTVGVPEADAPFVDVGDAARVRLQALDGRAFEGKVTRTAWALTPATRTLHAEIDLTNPDGVLRPGLYAYATVVVEEHRDVVTVPASAVFADGGKSYCVTAEGGRAKRREIRLGLSDGQRTEIVSGLPEGASVVEANAASLVDGRPVVEAPKPKS